MFKFHKDIIKLHQLILKYPVHIKFVKVTKILYIQIVPYFFGMTAVNFGFFFNLDCINFDVWHLLNFFSTHVYIRKEKCIYEVTLQTC